MKPKNLMTKDYFKVVPEYETWTHDSMDSCCACEHYMRESGGDYWCMKYQVQIFDRSWKCKGFIANE